MHTELIDNKPLIYTAMSKHYFYFKRHISKFVLENGAINPFMLFGYFLLDTVERDKIRDANNNIVKRVDELWVFGPISNGVLAEIRIAKKEGKPIKYFLYTEVKANYFHRKERCGNGRGC